MDKFGNHALISLAGKNAETPSELLYYSIKNNKLKQVNINNKKLSKFSNILKKNIKKNFLLIEKCRTSAGRLAPRIPRVL